MDLHVWRVTPKLVLQANRDVIRERCPLRLPCQLFGGFLFVFALLVGLTTFFRLGVGLERVRERRVFPRSATHQASDPLGRTRQASQPTPKHHRTTSRSSRLDGDTRLQGGGL